ncbi:ribonuclease P protein component [Blattabacterium cuenoti]|uniref:ribonuclease P protein component n=1 Tax=Blattabacterium cuenoti TaxID=1653831 RepID=UPI003120288B
MIENAIQRKKIFEEVIKNGKYLFSYPILSISLSKKTNNKKNLSIQLIGTLVKKIFFKKSVHRNRIKRLLKASFLLNKSMIEKYVINKNYYYIIFIYKAFYLPEFRNINESIIKIFNKIIKNHC